MSFFHPQEATPILEGIKEYHRSQKLSFRIPAHKEGRGADEKTKGVLSADPFRNDIGVLSGADDRTESHARQQKAEQLAARAYGAEHCYFSTNGTSLSVHAAMLAVAKAGEKVIVARNIHRSMAASLVLAGVIALASETSSTFP